MPRTPKSTKDLSSTQLLKKIVSSCLDTKGKDVAVLDVSKVFDLASYFIIVSGRSDRQVQGITNRIIEDLSQSGTKPLATDGLEQGHWVLLDYNDIIVHVFYEPLRSHYNLEGLWSAAKKLNLDRFTLQQKAA